MKDNFYDFKAKDINGNDVSMEQYKGKSVLIVNTASNCGFTPQYDGLQQLYTEKKDEDFIILGFPCDQFGHQEPGDEGEIYAFCRKNFGVTFPLFSKIDVNGPNTHPIFDYLKESLPGVIGGNIKWNFTKFLIDSKGNPVKRFAPTDTPDKITKYLEKNNY